MDRIYDYRDAKQLCASHQQILDTIQKIKTSHTKDSEKVKENATAVADSNVVSADIGFAVSSGKTNAQPQPNEIALIQSVYKYDIGQDIVTALDLEKETIQAIKKDIIALEAASSGLKWFLSSRIGKENANTAYQHLSELLQGEYVKKIKAQEDKYHLLQDVSATVAYHTLENNEEKYRQDVAECAKGILDQQKAPEVITGQIKRAMDLLNQHSKAKIGQGTREKSAKDDVEATIQPLIREQTMQELRKQDVEALSQKRSGIRIKALRDQGYKTVADVHAANQHQLASIYGISLEAAKVIKEAAQEIVQDISRTIKLKISSDDRTPAATKLLKAVYQYDRIHEADRAITTEVSRNLSKARDCTRILSELRNNLWWIFSTTQRKQEYADAYQDIPKCLTTQVIGAVNRFYQDVQVDSSISDREIWDDFTARSVEYFNLLEDLCPGVFGNRDTLYGLPEDLAREIQDQVYFPQGLKVSLRRYQEWGVKYILHQGKALLGDEMGLGKTVQAIATMVSLRNTGARKFMVVCPASVLPNWCKEIDKKSQFHSMKIHGPYRQGTFDEWLMKGGVAVTTYETLNSLTVPEIFQYDLLVVDEAHFIKNTAAIRSKNVRAFGKHAQRILFMTGTALENKVEEMISLLQALNPGIAKQAQSIAFMSTAPQFRQLIAPVYYRRKREDVLTELPAITNTNEWCDLLPEEEEAYEKAVLMKDRSAIRKVSWVTRDLRKSSKAIRMKEIIEEAEEDGRKILVFSFYLETIQRVIELLGKRCTQPINGSVSVERRQEIIDEFEKMPAGSVLPAQILAGGTGLNIQSASVVIICEPQLKPSIENQAISRAYRMGQTRKVLVYRLLASDTIDERIDDMLTEKQAIFDAFADISAAASATQKEEQQIDDKTFGKLIQEEIDRINAKNGYTAPEPAKQETKAEETAPADHSDAEPPKAEQAEPGPAQDESSGHATEPVSQEKATADVPVSPVPVFEQKPAAETKQAEETKPEVFSSLEEFITYVADLGIVTKDNREKSGCLWVKADPRIDQILEKQKFGDKRFKYSAKSKTLGGEPGWYY